MIGRRFGLCVGMGVLLLVAGCAPPNGAPPPTAAAPPAKPGVFFGARVVQVALDPSQPGSNGQAIAMRVAFTLDDSPSRAAGIRDDDLILALDGQPVTSEAQFQQAFIDRGPNASVKVTVLREGHPLTLDVTTLPRPADLDTRYATYAETHMKSEHQAAADAQAAGDRRAAFDHEVRALRLSFFATRNDAATQFYNDGLAHLATLLPGLRPPAVIPAEADWQNRRAVAILRSATRPEDYDRASGEFGAAMYAAPWVSDLYINLALTEEKAGYPEPAMVDLRRYLALSPGSRDSDQIKQRLAALEILAEERRPWLPFLGPSTRTDHSVEMVTLRGRDLKITMVAPPNPPNDRRDRVGDTIVSGTIRGATFTGKAPNRTSDEQTVRCFGPDEDLDAQGEIDGSGKTLTVRWKDLTFNVNSCQVLSTKWDVLRTYVANTPAQR